MVEIKPPKVVSDFYLSKSPSIFLAGSIEQGTAEDWQKTVCESLLDENVVIYNPRRDNWDSNWKQDVSNPMFKDQVHWELKHIYHADITFFYFSPPTKSPITLMELGYVLGLGRKPIVVCPEGFYRKGNVDIICNIHNVPVYNNITEGIKISLASLM